MESTKNPKPTEDQARAAVRTLISYAGDDPDREGVLETPDRVVRSFAEFFAGYDEDPKKHLAKTFGDAEGYDEMVLLKGIDFESHCEHHMVPFIGTATIGYIPRKRVVGISKLARVLDGYSRRLQIQEKLTMQIANAINDVLEPLAVGVVLQSAHQCMTTRGVHKPGAKMVTSCLLGKFREDAQARAEFLSLALGEP